MYSTSMSLGQGDELFTTEIPTWITTLVESMSTSAGGGGGGVNNAAAYKLAVKLINILILTFLMISMGTTIDLKDFKETFRHPAGFLVGMLCQFVLMPLIGFCMALAFSLKPAGALSVLILACCPGGTLSNIFTYWTKGDTCLSVSMTTVSTAVAIGMMPLNLFIYTRVWTSEKAVIPYVNIVITLVSILIPAAFGVFLRWWKTEWMTIVTRVGIFLSFTCIICAFILSFLLNPGFLLAGWQLWICAASLPLVGYSMGYGLARLLRQSHRKCRTIAFETGSQNVSLAMTLTVITFADSPLFLDMLFYPSLYACFIYLDSFPVILLFRLLAKFRKPMNAQRLASDGDSYSEGEKDHKLEMETVKDVAENDKETVTFNGHQYKKV